MRIAIGTFLAVVALGAAIQAREFHVATHGNPSNPGTAAAPLGDGCRIELGHCVRLVFRRPHALSATARLDFASAHHTDPFSDAVILMADSCVLGPKPQSHVVCRDWTQEIVIYRLDRQLYCRAGGGLEIDGKACRDRGLLAGNSRVSGEGFSFSLEGLPM